MSLNKQVFIISSTLEQALRRLRRLDTARVMWIDRVCINQDNIDKCNTQVAIMPDIEATGAHLHGLSSTIRLLIHSILQRCSKTGLGSC